jgi:hypothetical protein
MFFSQNKNYCLSNLYPTFEALTSWRRVIFDKRTFSQPVTKFPALYETRTFPNVLTWARHSRRLSKSEDKSTPQPSLPEDKFIFILPFTPRPWKRSLSFSFSTHSSLYISILHHTCHMRHSSHLPWFVHPNNGDKYKSWDISICDPFQPSVLSSLLVQILSSTPITWTPSMHVHLISWKAKFYTSTRRTTRECFGPTFVPILRKRYLEERRIQNQTFRRLLYNI